MCRRRALGSVVEVNVYTPVTALSVRRRTLMTTLDMLRDTMSGTVITADDPGYDEARAVYNFMIDRRPEAVAVCTSTADVVAVVNYARDTGADLAVRGGSHSVPGFGTADGAVVADLSGMREVRVDADARVAYVQGGATFNDVNVATGAHGLATPGGIISTTGVGGLTLGGGIGYLSRAYGLSIDNLVSVEIVTADGQVRTASEEENPDLFWAIRGGGGNFGVVTEFRFQLHPVADVLAGPIFFELADGPAVFKHYRDLIANAPREYGGFPLFNQAPPLPFMPEDRVGEPLCAVMNCWTGDVAEGEAPVSYTHLR